eukprot:gene21132-23207_t
MNIEKASKTDNNNELFPIKESKSEDPKETVQDATDCATRLLNQFTNDTKKCYTCSNCTDGVISKCTRTNNTVCRRRDIDNKGVVVGGELFERVKELGSNEEKTVQILKNMNIEKASKTNNNNELFPIKESKSEDPKETVQDATDCATRLLNQFTNDTKKCYTCSNCTDGVISKCTRTNDTIDHAEIVRANEEKLSELERHEEISNDVSTSTLSSDEQNSNGMKFREELSKFVENINAKYQNTYLDKCVNCRVCIAGQVPY